MKKRRMFGVHCARCDHEIIAPHRTEFLDDRSYSSSLAAPEMQGSVRVISKISQDCEVNQGTYGTCGPLRAAKWNKRFYLRSALGPNQILFSYDQDPLRKSST